MPDGSPSPAPRRSRRKDARPAEVIEAARDLFVTRGYAATKLEDVAKKAGVSVGLPYLYFENKEGLFKAVIRESILPQFRLGEDLLDAHTGSTEEFLRILAQKFWEMEQCPNAGMSKLVIAEAGNFPDIARFYMDEVILRGRRFFARILQRGIDRGEFRPMDVNQMARVAAAPLTMLSLWNHSLRPFEPDQASASAELYLDAYLDLLLRGLRAAPKDDHHD
ncbi:TetR/AcrR family transcriptional regulator [Azospirillum sp. sgz302134]